MTKLKFSLISAVVVAGVVLPFLIAHRAQVILSAKQETLHRQTDRIAQLTAENNRLSNFVAHATPPLSDARLTELLRLRSEVGQLRIQTSALQKLREDNRQLEARFTAGQIHETQMSPAEFDEKLAAETIEAMKNISAELPAAMERFAKDHNGKNPESFSEIRNYLPTSGGQRMVGLYAFDFVRDQGPKPGDALILGESGKRTRPDGSFARVYAFSDGKVVEVTTTNENDDAFFEAWEKKHMQSPSAPAP